MITSVSPSSLLPLTPSCLAAHGTQFMDWLCSLPFCKIGVTLKSQLVVFFPFYGFLVFLVVLKNDQILLDFRILGLSAAQIQKDFETNLPDYSMQKSLYARQFLQYCCHKALHVLTNRHDYLSDRDFRSLTYDMMLAWEDHCTENHLSTNVSLLKSYFYIGSHCLFVRKKKSNPLFVCVPYK